jgi:hypothetical protein
MLVGPVGFVGLVLIGFHYFSDASAEVKNVAYPALGVGLAIGIFVVCFGYSEAKGYCANLRLEQVSAQAYAAEHCNTLWPKES